MVNYILLGTLVIGLFAFVIRYMTRSNWRANRVGKYILYFMATVAVTFAYLLISPVVGRYPGREVVDFFVLIVLNITACRLTLLLWKVQRDERKVEIDTKEDVR